MRSLTVKLHDVPIGTLFESGGRYGLTFNDEYLAASPPPILSLAFLNIRGRAAAPKQTTVRMFPFFSNLLPEPNSRLRRYLAAQAGIERRDDMGLLRALGTDLPGAVTLGSGPWEDTPAKFAHREPLKRQLRFSLAGVQMKFSVQSQDGKFILRSDGTGGTHILKLPEPGKPQLPENEFAMMQFAAECGISVPAISLVLRNSVVGLPEQFGEFDGFAYIIERFDRSASGPIHIEDFAQVLRVQPDEKYERTSFDNIMGICARVMGEGALAEFVRRLVFNIAIGNGDMHLKNWSIRYLDRYTPQLAPAYDYVCTAAFPGFDDSLALPLANTSRWDGISSETFLRAARNARVQPDVVKDAVDDMKDRLEATWPRLRSRMAKPVQKIIERQLAIPLFRAA